MAKKKTIGRNPLDSVIPVSAEHKEEEITSVKTIEAERFILRDNNGISRMEIGVKPEGTAQWSMKDGSGRDRTDLEVSADGMSRLTFRDNQGKGRIILNMDEKGRANMVFCGQGATLRMAFGVLSNGHAFFELFDKDGRTSLYRAP